MYKANVHGNHQTANGTIINQIKDRTRTIITF